MNKIEGILRNHRHDPLLLRSRVRVLLQPRGQVELPHPVMMVIGRLQ